MGVGLFQVPLHQRLQIVKEAKGCSNSEALRLVFSGESTPSDDAAQKDPWNRAEFCFVSRVNDPTPPVAVVTDDKENDGFAAAAAGEKSDEPEASDKAKTLSAGVLAVTPSSIMMCSVRRGVREYVCDRAFSHTAPQHQVYDGAARPIVSDFLNGISGTVFMYVCMLRDNLWS